MINFALDPTLIAAGIGLAAFVMMYISTKIRDIADKKLTRNISSEHSAFQEREVSWDAEAIFVDKLVDDGNGSEVSQQEFLDSGHVYDIISKKRLG